jgi:hypothetical protein
MADRTQPYKYEKLRIVALIKDPINPDSKTRPLGNQWVEKHFLEVLAGRRFPMGYPERGWAAYAKEILSKESAQKIRLYPSPEDYPY